jgi:hypothetical protein
VTSRGVRSDKNDSLLQIITFCDRIIPYSIEVAPTGQLTTRRTPLLLHQHYAQFLAQSFALLVGSSSHFQNKRNNRVTKPE